MKIKEIISSLWDKSLDKFLDKSELRGAANLLDNSDFTNPVNQRGNIESTVAMGYVIDRWLFATPTVAVTVTLSSGVTVASANETTSVHIIQRLPKGTWDKENKTYTGAWCDGEGNITVTNGIFFGTSAEAYDTFECVVPTGSTVAWIAAYEGTYTKDTLPKYIPKGYATELMECKRYYQVIYNNGTDPSFFGYTGSNNQRLYFSYTLPIEMRVAPTITIKDGTYKIVSNGSLYSLSSSYLNTLYSTPHSVSLYFDTTGSPTFDTYHASSGYANNSYIILSADY